MAKANIANTLFATSAPLSLVQGFALFPSGNGPFMPGNQFHGVDQEFTLLNESDSFSYFNFDCSFVVGVFCGMAGPSFDMRLHLVGQTQDNGLAWATVSDDEFSAGVLFGAYLSATFGLSVSVGISVCVFSWEQTLVSENLTYTYDLIGNLAQEINTVLEQLGASGPLLVPVNTPIGTNGITMPSTNATAWGFLSTVDNAFEGGSVTITPGITLYIDIAPDVPYISDLASFLAIFGGSLSFGPTLSVQVPVTVNVTGLMTDANSYTAGLSLTPQQISGYNSTLANTLNAAYQAKDWLSPGAAAFLTQAESDVTSGQYPSVTAWFDDTIPAAGGTVPAAPAPASPPVVPGAPSGAITFSGGPATGATSITNVTLEMQHTVTFDITAGFSVSCSIDSYNYNNSWDVNILSLLGLPSSAGPYNDEITATNGNTTAPPLTGWQETIDRLQRELADVVFHPMLPIA